MSKKDLPNRLMVILVFTFIFGSFCSFGHAQTSTFSGPIIFIEPTITDFVDATLLQGGTTTWSVSGDIGGTLEVTPQTKIRIDSGTFSGAGFGVASYDLNGYTGTLYLTFDNNLLQKTWKVARGDIHATIIGDKSTAPVTETWYITEINGTAVSMTIHNEVVSSNAGPGGPVPLTNLEIVYNSAAGLVTANSTGYYTGELNRNVISVRFPAYMQGFVWGNYTSEIGTGEMHGYIDGITSPQENLRYIVLEGQLFGSVEVTGTKPVGVGSIISGTIEHVVQETPSSTKVPVHNGVWLIPSILGGLYLLRRRKIKSA